LVAFGDTVDESVAEHVPSVLNNLVASLQQVQAKTPNGPTKQKIKTIIILASSFTK